MTGGHGAAMARPPMVVARVVALGVCDTCGQVHDRCKAHRQLAPTEPCRRPAMRDQLVCPTHGGKSPQAKAKVEAKRTEARVLGEVGRLLAEARLEVEGRDLGAQLVDAINTAGAMALSYRWLLDQLPTESRWSYEDNVTMQGSMQRFVRVDESGLHGPDSKGVGQLHAYEEGLRYWTKLHGELLIKAATLGLDERRQAFEEAQVARIGDAITGIVHGLGRDLDDPTVVPVVEAALRAIAGEVGP